MAARQQRENKAGIAFRTAMERMLLIFKIRGTPNSEWIQLSFGEVYIRISKRVFCEVEFVPCVDVANVSIKHSEQRKGWWKFLNRVVEEFADTHDLYVYRENVLRPFLVNSLLRSGYVKEGDYGYFRAPKLKAIQCQCLARIEIENGEEVSPCHKLKGHSGEHEGYCLGSRAVWG